MTVAQINAYVKQLLDSDTLLPNVYVRGEISNFTNHYKTGHFYFTLKDSDGVLSAVMYKREASKLKFLPESGMKVVLHGRVTGFVRGGQYQIIVDNIEPDGVGSLYIAYEQLKRRLEAEGCFQHSANARSRRYRPGSASSLRPTARRCATLSISLVGAFRSRASYSTHRSCRDPTPPRR